MTERQEAQEKNVFYIDDDFYRKAKPKHYIEGKGDQIYPLVTSPPFLARLVPELFQLQSHFYAIRHVEWFFVLFFFASKHLNTSLYAKQATCEISPSHQQKKPSRQKTLLSLPKKFRNSLTSSIISFLFAFAFSFPPS